MQSDDHSRTLKTVLEMMTDRGYECDPLESFETMPTVLKIKNGPVIMWRLEPKIGIEDVAEIDSTMTKEKVAHTILVIRGALTPNATSAIKNLRVEKKTIEMFTVKELLVNVSHNEDVPKHRLCSKEEKDKVLRQFAVTADKLQFIKTTDPQVRYLGAKKGKLIHISRPLETKMEGEEPFFISNYRIVV